MSRLLWDQSGKRLWETGVDRGVLYLTNEVTGVYNTGFAWNGLTTVTESPSGGEVSPVYADNIQYLNLVSQEWFGASIEAYTYPEEFAQCDGTAYPVKGLALGQQRRRRFGLAYRTRLGNDIVGDELGYKLHLIYGALAAPTEKAYTTVNDSPEATTFSWDLTTEPVEVNNFRRTASLTVDSTQVTAAKLATLETALYGTNASGTTAAVPPRLPLPAEVITILT